MERGKVTGVMNGKGKGYGGRDWKGKRIIMEVGIGKGKGYGVGSGKGKGYGGRDWKGERVWG